MHVNDCKLMKFKCKRTSAVGKFFGYAIIITTTPNTIYNIPESWYDLWIVAIFILVWIDFIKQTKNSKVQVNFL